MIDDGEDWMQDILDNHKEEARSRVYSLLEQTITEESGCMVTPTKARRKTRFRGRQTAAYRFIFCVLNEEALTFEDVIRHRCNNPRCINPQHLEVGSRRDNKHDDWIFAAYGCDAEWL